MEVNNENLESKCSEPLIQIVLGKIVDNRNPFSSAVNINLDGIGNLKLEELDKCYGFKSAALDGDGNAKLNFEVCPLNGGFREYFIENDDLVLNFAPFDNLIPNYIRYKPNITSFGDMEVAQNIDVVQSRLCGEYSQKANIISLMECETLKSDPAGCGFHNEPREFVVSELGVSI